MAKTNAQLKADLDTAAQRILELEAELSAKPKATEAVHRAAMLRPDVEVLGAKLLKNGVLRAFYADGERMFDQDEQSQLKEKE